MKNKFDAVKKCALKYFIMLLVFCILTGIDRFTKVMAVKYLKNKTAFPLIKDVLEFEYLENTGAAYGMLRGMRILFIILTFIMIPLFIYAIAKIEKEIRAVRYDRPDLAVKYTMMQYIITMLTAGAAGNFIDRLLKGYVVDFIYFKLIDFPVFNVADCYITISAVLSGIFIIFILPHENKHENKY